MTKPDDLVFLRHAIRLSLDKMEAGQGGPFGAVVVENNQIVGQGWNQVVSSLDPTAHAEVLAIRDACAKLQAFSLRGCQIYCSCQPCPMCLAAIYWSRLDSIVYAASSEDAAAAGFDDSAFYKQLARPASERSVPMTQALRDEACEAFHAWEQKADRVNY